MPVIYPEGGMPGMPLNMTAEQKSYNCQEGSSLSAADSYINLQNYYSYRQEGTGMVFQKGNTIWLGRKRSENNKKNSSEAKKGEKNPNFGKPMSLEQRAKRSENAKINPNYGMKNKHHPEVSKEQISKANKGRVSPNKGKHPSEVTRNKLSESHKDLIPWNKGKKGCQIPWNKEKNGEDMPMFGRRGEEHPAWKGGIAFLPYCHKFNRILKEKLRDRDNRTCQLCSEKENGRKLSVHHIHYDKENCNPDLISLCSKCNTKVNFNRENYEEFFMNKLNENGLLFWRAT